MKTIFGGLVLVFTLMICLTAFAANSDYEKGIKLYFMKDYRNAVVYLKNYVSQNPDAKAYYFLGYASYKLKRFDEANGYFKEAYLIDPNITPVPRH